jgi:hypothetical protein
MIKCTNYRAPHYVTPEAHSIDVEYLVFTVDDFQHFEEM